MQKLNDYLLENPTMKLKEIAKLYNISISAVSRHRTSLGIKHKTSALCTKIFELLHLRNKDIAMQLECSETLVACVRFRNKKLKSTQRVDLTEAQKQIVLDNYKTLTLSKLAELVGVTIHVLRSRMNEMKLYRLYDVHNSNYDYDLDNGKGYFDIVKYKSVML